MKLGLLFFGLLTACASTSVVPIGRYHYAPLAEGTPVAVYSRDADVDCPFDVVALLHREDPGKKYDAQTLEDAIPALSDKARSVGANGIIVDEWSAPHTSLVRHGVDARARAIRTSCGPT